MIVLSKKSPSRGRRPAPTKLSVAQVKKLASVGMSKQEIAWFFEIDLSILDVRTHPQLDEAYKKGKQAWRLRQEGRIEELAALGLSQVQVAEQTDVSVATLRRRFLRYFNRGKESRRNELRAVQLHMAINEKNVAMAIFLGKNMLGQRDRWEIEQKKYDMTVVDAKLRKLAERDPEKIDAFIRHVSRGGDPMVFFSEHPVDGREEA